MKPSDIGKNLAEQTFQELGYDPKTGTFSRTPPVTSRRLPSFRTPFRIPAIEKTQRQWTSDQGYKASAAWQTASLLRDLTLLWTTEHLGNYERLREITGDYGSRTNAGPFPFPYPSRIFPYLSRKPRYHPEAPDPDGRRRTLFGLHI